MQLQKISILPPQKGLEFPGGGGGKGFCKANKFKENVQTLVGIAREVGVTMTMMMMTTTTTMMMMMMMMMITIILQDLLDCFICLCHRLIWPHAISDQPYFFKTQ